MREAFLNTGACIGIPEADLRNAVANVPPARVARRWVNDRRTKGQVLIAQDILKRLVTLRLLQSKAPLPTEHPWRIRDMNIWRIEGLYREDPTYQEDPLDRADFEKAPAHHDNRDQGTRPQAADALGFSRRKDRPSRVIS